MKKQKLMGKIFGIALVFVMIAAMLGGVPALVGKVEASPATEIWDWYDLDAVRNNLNGDYILMNGLDSTTDGYTELAGPAANGGKGWQPIGTLVNPFTGTFDDQGYKIRDLFIDRPDEDDVGLFGFVDEGGVIRNVGVVNVTVTGYRSVGGLVGTNGGAVTNSYSTGTVTGFTGVGGLVGANIMGTVSNSYATDSVNGTEAVGGLVGFNDVGIVMNSYYDYDEVLINSENIITTGALFGADFEEWLANGKFLDVNERLSKEGVYYVINTVTDLRQLLAFGQDSSLKFRLKNDLDLATAPNFYIPYLAGEFDGNGHKISNLSFNFDFVSQAQVGLFGYLASGGKVTQVGVENVNISADCLVGGLVGDNRGTVSKSYSTGRVTSEDVTGGLVGYNVGTVTNSYSSGDPTSKYGYVGGLVGGNLGTVTNSYSKGKVTGNEHVGGLVGENEGTVSNSFWDTQTSGQTTSAGGTGKTTAEMQDIDTFLEATWDICAVNSGQTNPAYTWNIVDGETYPFLNWVQKTLYVDDDLVDYPAADFTKIQDAVDAASPGDTIIVYPGTYTENVNVNKDHLTIRSEDGAEVTMVQAANPHDSVFDITAAYVNLNGFRATGAVAAIETEEHVAGIFLDQGTEHCSIYNNVVCDNSANGIMVRGLNHTLRNNSMSGNLFNISFDGNEHEPSDFIHDIDASNLVDGKPVYYWVNQHDKQIPSDAGFVGLMNCTNIAVRDLTLMNNGAGVGLISSSNSRIENVTTSDNFVGIALFCSSNNNIISDNTCNDIFASIYVGDSSNNTICINNFINNVEGGRSIDSTNTWHSLEEITYTYNGNTYTSYLGNYWSDYVGGDADGDGIGDIPYPMDSDPDNYPLMEPFGNYQIAPEDEPSPEVGFADLTAQGKLVIAYNFDPFTTVPTAVNGWTWYDPTLPPAQNNLAKLHKNTAYWIKVTEECWLTYGTKAYHLAAGWNNPVWLGC